MKNDDLMEGDRVTIENCDATKKSNGVTEVNSENVGKNRENSDFTIRNGKSWNIIRSDNIHR